MDSSEKHLKLLTSVASSSQQLVQAGPIPAGAALQVKPRTFKKTVTYLIPWVNKPFIHPENHLQTAAGVFLLDWLL